MTTEEWDDILGNPDPEDVNVDDLWALVERLQAENKELREALKTAKANECHHIHNEREW